MWIKWKYNNHGWPDFTELEVPDDVIEDYGTIENYICDLQLVPSYSERFMVSRIKWEKLEKPSKHYLFKKIKEARVAVKYNMIEANRLEKLLAEL